MPALVALLMVSYDIGALQAGQSSGPDQLLIRAEEIRREFDIPALALIVVDKDGVVAHGTLGLADKENRKEATPNTLFRIGSITKSFTALATLLLAEEGVLSLEDKYFYIAPEFEIKNRWRETHPIRIAHLLEHTAGLPDLTRKEFDFNQPLSLEEALDFRQQPRRAEWPPGKHHSYTNAGAGYVAYVIEKKSGMTYEEFVTERIFRPLGMDSAGFFPGKDTRGRLATGYDSDGTTVIPYWHMLFRAFGAINLEPGDMAPFLRMLLNYGEHNGRQLINPEWIKRMERSMTTLAARDGLAYGYGLGNYTWLRHGHLFHGHGGDGDGYLARYGYNREANKAYFVVINVFRHRDITAMRHLLEDYIVQSLEPVEKPAVNSTPEQRRRFAGRYRQVTQRFRFESVEYIKIHDDGESLYLDRGADNRRRLVPVNRNHFRFEEESTATMAFVTGESDDLFLQGGFGNYKKTNDNP